MARILVVDDDAIFGMLLRRRLQRAGHAVIVVDGPVGVMAELRAGAFDLMLLDLAMPALSGADLVRMIRAKGELASLKIVLCSSADEDDLRARASELAVDGWISKSDPMRDLLDTVARILDTRRIEGAPD